MDVFLGILIPFIGTVLGSMMVFFMIKNLNRKIEILILGFASGVMVAASIWSLIIPAIELNFFGVVIGLIFGFLFFWLMDFLMLKKDRKKDFNKMLFAITLHNIPEGMAIGCAFASYLSGDLSISLISCYLLSLGVGIQNFPEGMIVSLPMYKDGKSKLKSFGYGVLSALFELGGAIITLFFASIINSILPYLLAAAAGAMFYVVITELIPESDDKYKLNVLGFLLGFLIMMILDVTLG